MKEMVERNEKEKDAQKGLVEWELEERTGEDHLTGLKNRKAFEHQLEQALENIRKGKEEDHVRLKEISLISIDIDHFKQVNDTLGHPAGDEVLQKVAALLMRSVRGSDTVARVGGEELMVLMRGANTQVAARHAEELRVKIEGLVFDAHPELKVTASFGIISSENSTDDKTLVERVDQALYKAKENGRNRVEVYSGEA